MHDYKLIRPYSFVLRRFPQFSRNDLLHSKSILAVVFDFFGGKFGVEGECEK